MSIYAMFGGLLSWSFLFLILEVFQSVQKQIIGWTAKVWFLPGARDFTFFHNAQTSYGPQLDSCPVRCG
jgi:hypothetical protein